MNLRELFKQFALFKRKRKGGHSSGKGFGRKLDPRGRHGYEQLCPKPLLQPATKHILWALVQVFSRAAQEQRLRLRPLQACTLLLLDLTVPGPQHTKISVFILGTSACCSPWMQWMHEETQHNRGSLAELRPASISTDDPEGPNGSGCVSSGYG